VCSAECETRYTPSHPQSAVNAHRATTDLQRFWHGLVACIRLEAFRAKVFLSPTFRRKSANLIAAPTAAKAQHA